MKRIISIILTIIAFMFFAGCEAQRAGAGQESPFVDYNLLSQQQLFLCSTLEFDDIYLDSLEGKAVGSKKM